MEENNKEDKVMDTCPSTGSQNLDNPPTKVTLAQLCRMCAQPYQIFVNLLTEYENRPSYAKILKNFTGVSVTKHDKEPTVICTGCLNLLERCQKMKYEVLQTQVVFRELNRRKKQMTNQSKMLAKAGSSKETSDSTLLCAKTQKKQKKGIAKSTILDPASNPPSAPFNINEDMKENPFNIDEVKPHTGPRIKVAHEPPQELIFTKPEVSSTDTKNKRKRETSQESSSKESEPLSELQDNIEGYSCEKCKRKFKTSSAFNKHLCLQASSFPCSKCDQCFSSNLSLKKHEDSHDSGKPKIQQVICKHCMAIFRNPQDLETHLITVSMGVMCSMCSEKFSDQKSLNLHLKNQHSKDSTGTSQIQLNVQSVKKKR